MTRSALPGSIMDLSGDAWKDKFGIAPSGADFNAIRIYRNTASDSSEFYLVDELPEAFKTMLDTRICGIGERIVFEPYTREMYEKTHRWMVERALFEDGGLRQADYETAVL